MIDWIKSLFTLRPKSEYKLIAACHAFWTKTARKDQEVFYHLLEDQYGNRKCDMSKYLDAEYHPVYAGAIKSWLYGADISVVEFALYNKVDDEPEEVKPDD